MESMVHQHIFKKLVIYDLQGLCKNVTEVRENEDANASPSLMTVSLWMRENDFQLILTISAALQAAAARIQVDDDGSVHRAVSVELLGGGPVTRLHLRRLQRRTGGEGVVVDEKAAAEGPVFGGRGVVRATEAEEEKRDAVLPM